MKILIMNHIERILKYEIYNFFCKNKFYLNIKNKKIYNKKPKWQSESKLAELIKESPRFFQRQTLVPMTTSLPSISNRNEPYFYQKPSEQEPGTERKVNSL